MAGQGGADRLDHTEAEQSRRVAVLLRLGQRARADAVARVQLLAPYGPVRAIMAIAHKLLIAAFHMLSTGEAFRDLGESYLDQVARKRSTAKLVQRLSNLGYDVMLVPKAA